MTEALAAIASALQSDAEAVRVVSLNIANAQTPAYRREIALARASFTDAIEGLPQLTAPNLESAVDVRAGTLKSTGSALDVALEGKGFFVIGTAQGEKLTRRGDFRLDAEGRMVTQAGEPLLGMNGAISVGDGQPVISADGSVRAGDTVADKLRIVQLASEAALEPLGDGSYAMPPGEQAAVEGSSVQVRQGFLETSNVQPINETIQLMEAMRRFEMAQRFVRGYDSMVDQAISTLGKI
jgi:flagellar basal-body rod protein FlgG